jgi:hypothetical protein
MKLLMAQLLLMQELSEMEAQNNGTDCNHFDLRTCGVRGI